MPPVTRSQARNGQDITYTVDASGRLILPATSQRARTVRVYPVSSPDVKNESTRASVSAWPTLSTLSSLTDSAQSIKPNRLRTPGPHGSWTAGSVIMTPKKLQRSPGRIGGHSIDFWRNGSGVITQNIINGAESSQNSHDKGSGSDEAQSRDSQDYMRQMRLLIERREAELMAWAAAHADDDESIDDSNAFEDSAPHAKSGHRYRDGQRGLCCMATSSQLPSTGTSFGAHNYHWFRAVRISKAPMEPCRSGQRTGFEAIGQCINRTRAIGESTFYVTMHHISPPWI